MLALYTLYTHTSKHRTKNKMLALQPRYSNYTLSSGILLKTKEVGVYISLSTIFFVCLAVWLLKIWQDASSQHAENIRNKNNLIREAENVILSMDHLSWTEMTIGQQTVHECAIERLRSLKSLKKNHAPSSFMWLRDWPIWFDPKSRSILK